MELANVEKLLEKYLDAETSIAEENELKAQRGIGDSIDLMKKLSDYLSK